MTCRKSGQFELVRLRHAHLLMCFLCRPHLEAKEVYVTGTFDDWGKSEKLNKVGDTFEKEVRLPDASVKILYKVCQAQAAQLPIVPRKKHAETASICMIPMLPTLPC